ncbi:fumarylacetoacetate hydrolase family protein [Conexibacter sp. JD483]|uniref:fumarylacetoacetate hydrolase family protein n=1 Tax=unclassified Conexibacter TaxID=2627773 RepID=UPI00272504FE|nr:MULTISPECIES: fumarylacetoacetate hydrolase family protein [unclassified Conexibacter]MDO8186398.1 fumarylacetoacetate hydrolase family protein [Conexibacter sp. CPCC 205706]MDO8199797.1 fumarylacetoacetate hydrolase family protein [Conexibacter sp. CPCC 205762]MDR9369183.1 fumarylacetoacetate hydrolase family protein [Conexibacter sp. JD483]
MRIGTAISNGTPTPVVDRDGALYPLDVPAGTTVRDLIAAGGALPAVREQALDDATLTAPLAPGKIVAIGLNYMDHVRETGMEAPKSPLVFTKFTTSVIGDGDEIRVDRAITQRVDWEVELAAVIGRTASRVSAEEALSHVFGYTVANDVSARDVQFADGQWVRGKSLDTFCPLGPAIVTADEVADPQTLAITTRVNGEAVQDSNTKEMVFGVAELISFCSHSFTLEAGDVILTGTPWGCGEFMDPIRSLQAGDVVEVSVEGIGAITNTVVEL